MLKGQEGTNRVYPSFHSASFSKSVMRWLYVSMRLLFLHVRALLVLSCGTKLGAGSTAEESG